MSTATAAALPSDAPPAKGKGKLILIAAIVFAVLAAVGGAAAWFFHQKAANAEAKGDEAKPAAKKSDAKPPVFNTLENFTVNLAGEGEHFLQLGVVLQLKDEDTAEKVKAYLPQIRNKILLLLSAKTADDLQSPKGKQALIDEILVATREPLRCGRRERAGRAARRHAGPVTTSPSPHDDHDRRRATVAGRDRRAARRRAGRDDRAGVVARRCARARRVARSTNGARCGRRLVRRRDRGSLQQRPPADARARQRALRRPLRQGAVPVHRPRRDRRDDAGLRHEVRGVRRTRCRRRRA